jgi:Fe-S cluster biosynthesis and repair protein YggX
MSEIQCSRCGQRGLRLPKPPLAGATGQAVQTHICAGCWGEWQRAAPGYINHYAIQVVDPAGRAKLYELMREFLNIPTEA